MMSSLRKAKIKWHCRRGMLELDLILLSFVETQLEPMTEQQLDRFEQLLDASDPELFSWLMGHEQPENKELASLVESIKQYHCTQ